MENVGKGKNSSADHSLNSTSSSTSASNSPSSNTAKIKPTVEDLTERTRKWIVRESAKAENRDISAEDISNSFNIVASGHSFSFKCHRLGCKEKCVVPYSALTNDASLSNAYRHLKLCLFGIKRNGKGKALVKSRHFTKSASNFFTTRKTNKKEETSSIDLTERVFVPRDPEDTDFQDENISNSNHEDINNISHISNETSEPKPTTSTPKNLQLPAGQTVHTDDSGH